MQIGGRLKKTSHKKEEISGSSDFLVSQNQILTIQADLFSERICAHLAQWQIYALSTPTCRRQVRKCVRIRFFQMCEKFENV